MIYTSISDIFTEKNLQQSIKHVVRNRASPGLSEITGDKFPAYWEENGKIVRSSILKGTYKPEPVLRQPIAKDPKIGSKRMLEIPTILDRVILYTMYCKLEPEYRKTFSDNSFGFIEGRGTEDALRQCLKYINEGKCYAAVIDIKGFFDNVEHNCLIRRLETTLADNKLINLIKLYLNQKVTDPIKHACFFKHRGLGQGSPLSPLLANIVLDDVDRFFEKLNYSFVRYADDIVILCESKRSAEAAIQWADTYLKNNLKLSLNMEKTKVTVPEKMDYLGYSFIKRGDKYVPCVSSNSVNKLHTKIEKSVRWVFSDDSIWFNRIGALNRGWLNYFRYADPDQLMEIAKQAEYKQVYEMLCNFRYGKLDGRHQHELLPVLDSKGFTMMTKWCEELEKSGNDLIDYYNGRK